MKKEFIKPEIEVVKIDVQQITTAGSPTRGKDIPEPIIPTR